MSSGRWGIGTELTVSVKSILLCYSNLPWESESGKVRCWEERFLGCFEVEVRPRAMGKTPGVLPGDCQFKSPVDPLSNLSCCLQLQ
jgi:hypothetical protein